MTLSWIIMGYSGTVNWELGSTATGKPAPCMARRRSRCHIQVTDQTQFVACRISQQSLPWWRFLWLAGCWRGNLLVCSMVFPWCLSGFEPTRIVNQRGCCKFSISFNIIQQDILGMFAGPGPQVLNNHSWQDIERHIDLETMCFLISWKLWSAIITFSDQSTKNHSQD